MGIFNFSNIVENLLFEGVESKNMKLAKHYLYDNCGYDEGKAMEVIGSIKRDIPNVRLGKCKFILGVTRMFIQRQLVDAQTIMGLNSTLRFVSSQAHINEYDNDLNGISCQELLERFGQALKQDLSDKQNELNGINYTANNDYKIVKIPDFDTAEQYNEYTDWCVTHYPEMYNQYTACGLGVFYFCLKNGFEEVPKVQGENCPLDEYGLSMIAVSVNEDGSCNTITCRWNHDNGGNDNIMTDKELSNLIGRNFYQTFMPYTPEEIEAKKKQNESLFTDGIEDYIASGQLEYLINNGYNRYIDIIKREDPDDYDEDDNPIFYDINGDPMYDEYGDLLTSGPVEFYIISNQIDSDSAGENLMCDLFGDKEKFVILNSYFDFVSKTVYDEVQYNEDSQTFTVKKDGKTDIINGDGYNLMPMQFEYINVVNDLAVVKDSNNGWTFLRRYNQGRYQFITNKWFKMAEIWWGQYFLCFDKDTDLGEIYDANGNKIIDGFTHFKTVSELLFLYSEDNSFYLYLTDKQRGIQKVSNIPFKEGQGFHGGNMYSCIGTDGQLYEIDYKNKKTYLHHTDETTDETTVTLVDQINESKKYKVKLTELQLNRIIKESLDRFLLKEALSSDVEAAEVFKSDPNFTGYDDPSNEGAYLLTNGKIIYVDTHYFIQSTGIQELGAIRFSREAHAISVVEEPNELQYSMLASFASRFMRGRFDIDIQYYWAKDNAAKLADNACDKFQELYEHTFYNNLDIGSYDKTIAFRALRTELEKILKKFPVRSQKISADMLVDYIKTQWANIREIAQNIDYYEQLYNQYKSQYDLIMQKIEKHGNYRNSIMQSEVIPVVRKNFSFDSLPNSRCLSDLEKQIILIKLHNVIKQNHPYIMAFNGTYDLVSKVYGEFMDALVDTIEDGSDRDSIDFYNDVYNCLMRKEVKPQVMTQLENIINAMLQRTKKYDY